MVHNGVLPILDDALGNECDIVLLELHFDSQFEFKIDANSFCLLNFLVIFS